MTYVHPLVVSLKNDYDNETQEGERGYKKRPFNYSWDGKPGKHKNPTHRPADRDDNVLHRHVSFRPLQRLPIAFEVKFAGHPWKLRVPVCLSMYSEDGKASHAHINN